MAYAMRAIASLILVVAVVSAGCRPSTSKAMAHVQKAVTAAAEKEAFDEIWRSSGEVSFAPYDASEHQVDMSAADWEKRVDHIRLTVNGQTVEHKMIAKENIFLLMRE